MKPTLLSIPQLKSALEAAWKKHSVLKKEMAPLLLELRSRLKSQGKKGGWAAWVEAGNIGICLRTANRWADECAGKKPKPQDKSREVPDLTPDGMVSFQVSFVLPEEEHNELLEACQVVGNDEVPKIIRTAILNAAKERRQSVQHKAAHA
jgi:hypothetical protein